MREDIEKYLAATSEATAKAVATGTGLPHLDVTKELNRMLGEAVVEREKREREEAAAREAREREAAAARAAAEEKERAEREQRQREREDFLIKGPGLDAIVAVLAEHYHADSTVVMSWLFMYDIPATTTAA
ncbi:hypothetical protein [Burkholderia vietnamiensis]|uniref:hypothetical protein n=1 Tax=Burkholderia vietnamiensis TaxID=60552 RepID=UPI001CF44786|nr:hypothetical protein [Burkholderia vietnamiensis]MCA8073161.1 hypothetical protein [Burkholderia vietnamiensis]